MRKFTGKNYFSSKKKYPEQQMSAFLSSLKLSNSDATRKGIQPAFAA